MRFAQEISIFNPYAIEKQVIALGTSITQTAREIEMRADEMYAEKGEVITLSSRISQMPHTITMSVSGTASKKVKSEEVGMHGFDDILGRTSGHLDIIDRCLQTIITTRSPHASRINYGGVGI